MLFRFDKVLHDVLALLGESPHGEEGIPAEQGWQGLAPDRLVYILFPDAATDILLDSRAESPDSIAVFKHEPEAVAPDAGRIPLPDDFLYLVAFQMPDWTAPLAGAASGETLRGALGAQIPPLMKRMRTSLHPLVCIGKDNLFYYGTAFPGEAPVMASYMPRPRWLPDLTISLPGEAYAKALSKTASLISAIC